MKQRETYNRVKKAFRTLRQHNLICRMNHLCCMTCASHDLGTKCNERNKEGAVYFHQQDTDCFWGCSKLHIRYFHNDEDDDGKTLEVGKLVYQTLKEEGVTVEWDGNAGKTIVVLAEEE